jgi:hypothetical protein
MADEAQVAVRRTRGVRLVEHPNGISVYPEPHDVPVLPTGWAPLNAADLAAVLAACNAHPHVCRLRIGSPWDPAMEYRVYALDVDAWHGVCVATMCLPETAGAADDRGNIRVLAVARDVRDAARIAIDFFNWDLEAEGARWRLAVTPVASDPPAA